MRKELKIATNLANLIEDAPDDMRFKVIVSHPHIDGETSDEYLARVSAYYLDISNDVLDINFSYSQVKTVLNVSKIMSLIEEDYTARISWDTTSSNIDGILDQ